jgi:hypothetical protein
MQEQPETKHEGQQAGEGQGKSSTVPPGQAAVEQPRRANPKRGYFSKPHNWINLLTLLFVGAYTVITFFILYNSQEQIKISRDVEKRQLRAYVFIDTISPFVQEKLIEAVIHFKNSGQTPAYDASGWIRMATRPKNQAFVVPEPSPPSFPFSKTIIGPQGEVIPRGMLDIPPNNTALLPALKADLVDFYAWGEFRYKDTFGTQWCLEFRQQSVRRGDSWLMQATAESNEEIEGECPNWPTKGN